MNEYYFTAESPEACYDMGNNYYFGINVPVDKESAFLWYEEAANKGHVAAQYCVATMYRYGQGVEKNAHWAAYWYEKAAEQDYELALAPLAELYYKGPEKDLEKAYLLYDKLAETGSTSALYNLGNMFEHGEWVYESEAIALNYYSRAAFAGHAGAEIKLEKYIQYS